MFHEHKALTKDEIACLCGCSRMTLWRKLEPLGYLTSYNENARYYTLADIPAFDERGWWRYRNARFSRYGSLPETLVSLVAEGVAGYSARELSEILSVDAGPELTRLSGDGRIEREKLKASFIYVSSDEKRRAAQLRLREQQFRMAEEKARLPVPETIIAVLVELVKQPGLQPESLVRRLKRRGVSVTQREVRNLFTRYDLPEKRGR